MNCGTHSGDGFPSSDSSVSLHATLDESASHAMLLLALVPQAVTSSKAAESSVTVLRETAGRLAPAQPLW